MSLFRKPKKHIQRRVFSSNEDDDATEHKMEVAEEEEKPNVQPVSKVKKSDKKERSLNSQTLLSFGDEEEGEVFQVKKSSHSKKIMRLLDKKRRNKKEEKIETEETKEKTEEKRTEIVTGDLVMVVKSWESPRILNGRAALCAGRDDMSGSDDEDDDCEPEGKKRLSDSGVAAHRFSHPDTVRRVLESGRIPDAAMIHAARKRRQRARELGGAGGGVAGGCIGADSAVGSPADEPPDKGRLVREEDESDEERMDMSVNHVARDRDQRREQFFAAQDDGGSEHDTDREMEEWENQQIRKGVTGAQLMVASQEAAYGQTAAAPMREISAPPAVEPPVPRTPQAVVDRLRERLTSVRETYEKHARELERVCSERETAQKELAGHQERAPQAAQRFRFYQELRGYVTDLVECLDEKVSVIGELEERALDLMSRSAERLMERRRQDVRDQAEEVAMQTRPGARRPVAGAPEEEARVRRAAEREGRRARRRRAREGAASGQPRHIEGMSSDDEVPDQDALNERQQRDALLAAATDVFSDVVEEYGTVAGVLGHFGSWRDADMNSYTEAYASLCLPKVLGPRLRLALLLWNPLLDSDDLDKQQWYQQLMLYGARGIDSEDALLNDPDVSLVPTVVDKIIVPKLTQLVEKCWDPMSSTQTLRLVGLIGRYIRRYPSLGPDSKSLSTLFGAVVDRLKSAVEHDVFIPIFSKQTLESRSPFFQRQFASGLKLLRNVTSWQGLLNDKLLRELALGALLNRYLLNGMRVCQLTDAVSKAGLISHSLPRVWLQADLHELGMFTAYVTQLASQLDKDNPLHLESLDIVTSILKSLRCT